MEEESTNRLLAENLKIMRNYIYLKREVILLKTERETRERKFSAMESLVRSNNNAFISLEQSYKNIKEMQNELSYQNSILISKIRSLENMNAKLLDFINKDNTNNVSQ